MTAIDIIMYRNDSPNNKLCKQLTEVATASGFLRESVSITSPTIRLQLTNIGFNYVKIPAFNCRFYYVTDITCVRGSLFDVSLRCDVLQTYANQVGACTAIVSRNTENYNLYLPDSEIQVSAKKKIDIIPVKNWGSRQPFIILTTKGESADVTEPPSTGDISISVNVTPAGAGTFTLSPAGTYNLNESVTVTATPEAGHTFLRGYTEYNGPVDWTSPSHLINITSIPTGNNIAVDLFFN